MIESLTLFSLDIVSRNSTSDFQHKAQTNKTTQPNDLQFL